MWQLGLVIGYLTYIVQKTCSASCLYGKAQLRCHDTCQVSGLAGVLQEVLTIRRTIFHLTDKADKLGVQTMDTQVDSGALTYLDNLLLNLLLDLCYNLLDACRVDAAVGNKLVQGQTGDLTANRVEATQDNSLGGVINDNLDACGSLQSADVTTLTADDATLNLVAVDIEYRHGILDGCLGGNTLDRGDDNTLCLLGSGELCLLDGLVDI